LACVPAVREPVVAAIGDHLFRKERWLQTVTEAEPLFAQGFLNLAGWDRALQYFGPFAPLSLLLLPLAIVRVAKTAPARAGTFAWFALSLLGLTLIQNRFARSLYPFVAVWSALGIVMLLEALERTPIAQATAKLLRASVVAAVFLSLSSTDAAASRVRARD